MRLHSYLTKKATTWQVMILLSWFILHRQMTSNDRDKRAVPPLPPPHCKDYCLAPAINKTCQCLRIWASVDLLFGRPDSLARFPARGKGKNGGKEEGGGEMSEPRQWLRDLSLLWCDVTEAGSISQSVIFSPSCDIYNQIDQHLILIWLDY